MKKITSVILAVALIFALAVTAMAAEIADCTVSADSVSATAGGTVTVPIRISGTRGFTNFGIARHGCSGRSRDGRRNSVHGHVPGQWGFFRHCGGTAGGAVYAQQQTAAVCI